MDKKVPDISGLAKKTDFNTKVTEIEGKLPSITGLPTNSALTAVENKILDVSSLVKKTHLDAELKNISVKVTSNKFKHFPVEKELKKLEKFDAAYFRSKNYFDGYDGTQNYLVFQTTNKYFTSESGKLNRWKAKGLSNQFLFEIGGSNKVLLSKAIKPIHVTFKDGNFLNQLRSDVITNRPIVNIHIVYRLSLKIISSSIALKNCLFGATKIANRKAADEEPQKYKYSGYGITFDCTGHFTHANKVWAGIWLFLV